MTYAQLWFETEQLKDWLSSCNISCLGFQLDNGLIWLLLDIAAIKANISLIPLPMFFSDQQVKHVLDHAPVDMLISQGGREIAAEWYQQTFPLNKDLNCYQRSLT